MAKGYPVSGPKPQNGLGRDIVTVLQFSYVFWLSVSVCLFIPFMFT